MKHLLNFENEDKQYLEKLVDEILKIDLEKLNKINSFALLQFNEPSTRTRLSFSIAAKKLGINVEESQDSISAKEKGESLKHEIERLGDIISCMKHMCTPRSDDIFKLTYL